VLTLRKVAVTGGLAAGKSTVCQLFKEWGAYVVDADEIVRQQLEVDTPTGQQVINLLGPDIIVDNQIDRKKVSDIVFSNPEKLKSLETILHPVVRQEINRLFEAVKENASYRFFVAEVPLLYEAKMQEDFDVTIAVICDEQLARERPLNKKEFDRRSRFQLSQAAKQARADYVIVNQGDLTALKTEVSALIPKIIKES
jgi:dephospho-CoA kinase